MSGPLKVALLLVIVVFGSAAFYLGLDMVASPSTYEWLVPSRISGFLGQTLMFLSFLLTLGSVAYLTGLGRPSLAEEEPPPLHIPSAEVLIDHAPVPFSGSPFLEPRLHAPLAASSASTPIVPGLERPHLIGLTGGVPKKVPISKARFLIGRSPECDLILSSQLVSRRHAQIVWDGETLSIQDLGSDNQTRVNDQTIAGRQTLQDGDVIQILEYHLEVELPTSLAPTILLSR